MSSSFSLTECSKTLNTQLLAYYVHSFCFGNMLRSLFLMYSDVPEKCFSHLLVCGILSTTILGNLMIQESESKRRGLMAHLSAQCSLCLEETPFETSSFISKWGRSVDVNRRIVYHSIETGGGYKGLASFCSITNMPCIAKTVYYQHVETILDALELEAENDMKQAGQRLQQHILGENGDGDSNEVVDAAVSFDGTWAKRGFTSLTGVVFVISVDTREVLIRTSTRSKCVIHYICID